MFKHPDISWFSDKFYLKACAMICNIFLIPWIIATYNIFYNWIHQGKRTIYQGIAEGRGEKRKNQGGPHRPTRSGPIFNRRE